jgi:hypothetical protein
MLAIRQTKPRNMEHWLEFMDGTASLNRGSAYTCSTMEPMRIDTAIANRAWLRARFDASDFTGKQNKIVDMQLSVDHIYFNLKQSFNSIHFKF